MNSSSLIVLILIMFTKSCNCQEDLAEFVRNLVQDLSDFNCSTICDGTNIVFVPTLTTTDNSCPRYSSTCRTTIVTLRDVCNIQDNSGCKTRENKPEVKVCGVCMDQNESFPLDMVGPYSIQCTDSDSDANPLTGSCPDYLKPYCF